MTPDLMGVLKPAADVVGEKLDAVHRLGPAYMKAYAEWYLNSKALTSQPKAPAGLAPELARMLRDEVKESALVARTSTARVEATPRRAARERLAGSPA